MLETLMKQKQELVAQKQSINEEEDSANVKSRLEAYDQQIAALDEAIAQIEAQSKEEPKPSSGIYQKPKTAQQQAEAEKAKRLMDIAAVHDQAQALFGLRAEMLGRANVLGAELNAAYSTADLVDKAQESVLLHAAAMRLGDHMMEVARDVNDSVQKQSKEEVSGKVLS